MYLHFRVANTIPRKRNFDPRDVLQSEISLLCFVYWRANNGSVFAEPHYGRGHQRTDKHFAKRILQANCTDFSELGALCRGFDPKFSSWRQCPFAKARMDTCKTIFHKDPFEH